MSTRWKFLASVFFFTPLFILASVPSFSQVVLTVPYQISWEPPTRNVDGTTITKLPVSIVIQSFTNAAMTQGKREFSAPANARTANVVSDIGPLWWRVAAVDSSGTYSDWVPATGLTTDKDYLGLTKPECWPKPIGTGTWAKTKQNTMGFAVYWQCSISNLVWTGRGFYGLWSELSPSWTTILTDTISHGPAAIEALWTANIDTAPVDMVKYAAVKPLMDQLKIENPLPSLTYKVKANGTQTTRPAYSITAGARTSTTIGRVAVGAACNCTEFQSGEYCAVTGRENAATAAVDTLPPSAAVCVAQ